MMVLHSMINPDGLLISNWCPFENTAIYKENEV
jgi:hypothetical protein